MKTLMVFYALCFVCIAYAGAGIWSAEALLLQSARTFVILRKLRTGETDALHIQHIQLAAPIQVGQKAYSFKLASIDGRKIELSHFTEQGIVVISISSAYPGNAMYFANLERVYKDYRETNLTVLAVISKQNADELSALKEQFDLSYPILPDPKDTVVELYELKAIPTILIIDNSGVVRYSGTFTHWTDLEEQIESVMAAVEGKSPNQSDYANIEAARKSLRSFDRYLRWHAVKALGDLGSKQEVPALIAALNDNDRCTRWHAIQSLGKLRDIRAIAALSEALKSDDGGIRELAAQALGQIGNKAAMEPLIKAINDDSQLVRLAVIKALGDMKDNRVVSSLAPLLGEDFLLPTVAEALIKQEELAVSPLIEVLEGRGQPPAPFGKGDDRQARKNAVYTLGKIAQRIGPAPIVKVLEQKEQLDRLRQIARADTARLYVLLGRTYRERLMFDASIESYQKSLAMLSGREYTPVVTEESAMQPTQESEKTGQAATTSAVTTPPTTSAVPPAPILGIPQGGTGEILGTAVGNIAPNFTLFNLNGEQVNLYDFRGKVVILYFWALWSGDNAHDSMKQIQAFNNIYKGYKAQGVEVLGVPTDENDAETVKSFEDTYDINFPILLSNDQIIPLYQITTLPAIFLIDRSGKIRKTYTGYKTGYLYDIDVKAILAK
ncbi:redoxin domain-containing protein [Candidatus Poribacteria bacterium]|nr:redoxin domain-containing protein [Candidatus Poribacteria bacterium]